ncbi:helix-turn-helix domain-containing protein [Muricoccus radiodurans]|uniref:helix-turn-helix domain-containing protein n=1 Tax=Muricoccus radiodurans TaxID=2231721 RepID=UPI003CE71CEC
MLLRLRAVDLAPDLSFKLSVTQGEFGDALGLSTVHVNRVLQDLRREGLIAWTKSTVTVLRWEGLQELCAFDPTYLHQDHKGRP